MPALAGYTSTYRSPTQSDSSVPALSRHYGRPTITSYLAQEDQQADLQFYAYMSLQGAKKNDQYRLEAHHLLTFIFNKDRISQNTVRNNIRLLISPLPEHRKLIQNLRKVFFQDAAATRPTIAMRTTHSLMQGLETAEDIRNFALFMIRDKGRREFFFGSTLWQQVITDATISGIAMSTQQALKKEFLQLLTSPEAYYESKLTHQSQNNNLFYGLDSFINIGAMIARELNSTHTRDWFRNRLRSFVVAPFRVLIKDQWIEIDRNASLAFHMLTLLSDFFKGNRVAAPETILDILQIQMMAGNVIDYRCQLLFNSQSINYATFASYFNTPEAMAKVKSMIDQMHAHPLARTNSRMFANLLKVVLAANSDNAVHDLLDLYYSHDFALTKFALKTFLKAKLAATEPNMLAAQLPSLTKAYPKLLIDFPELKALCKTMGMATSGLAYGFHKAHNPQHHRQAAGEFPAVPPAPKLGWRT